ncbi:type VII secretion protein EssC [Miniphocaeibacter massiliensis]|uniref:type VII secretion protein EssC n=1 Tax=Miniphocaeibacter massiliensis TaxID=2041841 RepID=UPI000C1BF1BF|nr:type VII secretion protein EssC [Miniphocaeibacter massiliensis]
MNELVIALRDEYYKEFPSTEPWIKQLEENDENIIYILKESHTFNTISNATLFIGRVGDVQLKTNLMLKVEENSISVEGDLTNECVYLNQFKLAEKQFNYEIGDVLFFVKDEIKIIIFKDNIQIIGDRKKYSTILVEEIKKDYFEGYPYYKRSPRIVKRVPTEKVEIKAPPQKAGISTSGLLQTILPPLAMATVTVGVGVMLGRGMYLLISVAGATVTTIMAIVRYFNDKKTRKETNKKRNHLYKKYLLKKRKELYETLEQEKEAYHYNYPSIKEQSELINNYNHRLYERVNTDDDFLNISIGKQESHVTYPIEVKETELVLDNDDLEEEARNLKSSFSQITKERVIQLRDNNLGLIGNKNVIHEQLNLYISQLVTFHSYHELQIIMIYDKAYDNEFEWMRWLPHTKIHLLNVRGIINSERTRDQILNSLNQILKDREQIAEESKKDSKFAPHYLFVIDEPKLVMDHFIMEFLNRRAGNLDFSIIYTSYLQENLPENINTILLLEDSTTGRLLLEEKEVRNETVKLPRLGDTDLEKMSRNLSVITHVQGMASQIPESINFFELYGVSKPEEFNILDRWTSHSSHKSLDVPLGVRAENDIVSLNLHEKAHGPHGLVAGTTGSGKSEIIQSYILSLAINFHPYEVGFLLIDYKGGGMASLFKDLPHLMGTITNLDGSESMRAMASIKSELERRQRLFSANGVNHINGYNELFKEGKVEEPIPHLFLISDEFAELKKEQPEFMKELVSAARIGRSLGVHLILATQKPSGVVDDQIWSNSKFKLALKVQDESDSKEILKTPDAASIVQPGRAYLQVGNNEIYELFQSAWSGAIYVKDQQKEVTMDNRVYLVNELGQGQLINQDLSGSKEENKSKETQLDATIKHISEIYDKQETVEIQKPWLPSLKKHIQSPVVEETNYLHEKHEDLSIPLGLLDIPETQTQESYIWNGLRDGNIAYIASSGYGKSVFLTTVALSLAKRYEVKETYLYILDFGSNALISLRNLPHTAEYIGLDDEERYRKFKTLILQEIGTRKKKLAQKMAQNILTYNQLSDEKLPIIVILIDNYDAIKEMGFEEEEYFTKITRDGSSLGIYFVITATRSNAVRIATLNNFKQKIAGFNFEPTEIMTLIGRSPYKLGEIKGRSLIKKDDLISTMQIYSMAKAEDELSYIREVQEMVQEIRERETEEAPHIPILPEELTKNDLNKYPKDNSDLYLGLEKETVTLTGLSRFKNPFLIFGESQKGKTHNLKTLIEQAVEKEAKVVIFDSKKMELYSYHSNDKVEYIKDKDHFVTYIDELEEEVASREEHLRETLKTQTGKTPQSIVKEMIEYYIFVDELDDFYAMEEKSKKEITELFQRLGSVGITLVTTATVGKLQGPDELTRWIKQSKDGLLLSPQGYQSIFPIPFGKDKVNFGDGILFEAGIAKQLQLIK